MDNTINMLNGLICLHVVVIMYVQCVYEFKFLYWVIVLYNVHNKLPVYV